MLNFKIYEKSIVNALNDKLLYFIKFSIFIIAIVLFNTQISVAGELSKSHKDSLDQECTKLTKNNEYKSINQCKRLRTSAIKQKGILINFSDHEEEDGSYARIGCSGQIKNGIFVYNECLANLLGVNIIPDPPPKVVEEIITEDGTEAIITEEGTKAIITEEIVTDEKTIASANEVYKKVLPGTFWIEAFDSMDGMAAQGTAVGISKYYFATNCHILEKNRKTKTLFKNFLMIHVDDDFTKEKNWYSMTLFKHDSTSDRCILFNDQLNNSHVGIKNISDLELNEIVYAVGNPEGFPGVITEGVIQRIYKKNSPPYFYPVETIQTNTHMRHGNSGGGLYDSSGVLVGITSFGQEKQKDGDDAKRNTNPFNFAIPAERYIDLLRQ